MAGAIRIKRDKPKVDDFAGTFRVFKTAVAALDTLAELNDGDFAAREQLRATLSHMSYQRISGDMDRAIEALRRCQTDAAVSGSSPWAEYFSRLRLELEHALQDFAAGHTQPILKTMKQ